MTDAQAVLDLGELALRFAAFGLPEVELIVGPGAHDGRD